MGGLEGMLLVVTSRAVEFIGIVMTFYLFFKGYKAKYVYLVGAVVLLSITSSLTSVFFREYFFEIAIGDLLITCLLLFGILAYVVKNPERTRDFTPPEEARCPFCNALIVKEEELCTMKVGSRTLYFDSCDHFVRFLKEVDFLEKRGSVPKGKVSEVFLRARDTGNWKSISNITVVEEEGVYTAYERPPEGAKVLNLEGILADFKDKVRRDGS